MEKKIYVCGNFGSRNNYTNGQSIKTRILYKELINILGEDKISKLDSTNWTKNPFSFFYKCVSSIKDAESIIILTAHNGVNIFIPLFTFLKIFKNVRLHYVVIGAWLPKLVKKNLILRYCLTKFTYIHAETKALIKELDLLGIKNTSHLINFKSLEIIDNIESEIFYNKPLKLCTLSRVMEEKGITDLVNTINKINKDENNIIFKLDIYGPIDEVYKEKFYKIIDNKNINYCGIVDYDKTVEILKDYFMLIFPTKFKTEGIPGTIIDAYAAGVPILASDWNSSREIIDETTGIIYEFDNLHDLKNKLYYIANNPNEIINKKNKCRDKAFQFQAEEVIKNFVKLI